MEASGMIDTFSEYYKFQIFVTRVMRRIFEQIIDKLNYGLINYVFIKHEHPVLQEITKGDNSVLLFFKELD